MVQAEKAMRGSLRLLTCKGEGSSEGVGGGGGAGEVGVSGDRGAVDGRDEFPAEVGDEEDGDAPVLVEPLEEGARREDVVGAPAGDVGAEVGAVDGALGGREASV